MVRDIKEILARVDKLPELFYVAVRVSKMLDDFNVDIHELSKMISLDQAMTTELLKLCNSAHYGFSRKIVSINDAVAKLGFKTLKSLVYMAVSKGVLKQEVKGYDLEKGELWRNSVSCAVYAKKLAEIAKYKDPELAFTAGLLRDIGKLIMHEYVRQDYNKILRAISTEGVSFIQAEEMILGFSHSRIGAEVAVKWNFPAVLTEAIRYHHNPEKALAEGCEDYKLISIIHVADSLCMMMGAGIGNDGMMYNLELKSLDALGIEQSSASIEHLISEMLELNDEIRSMASMVNE